jgi:hypothetical protein
MPTQASDVKPLRVRDQQTGRLAPGSPFRGWVFPLSSLLFVGDLLAAEALSQVKGCRCCASLLVSLRARRQSENALDDAASVHFTPEKRGNHRLSSHFSQGFCSRRGRSAILAALDVHMRAQQANQV